MSKLKKILAAMETSPQNVRFSDLTKVCSHYFGKPRNQGTSHYIYRTPRQGDPRINIQEGKMVESKFIKSGKC